MELRTSLARELSLTEPNADADLLDLIRLTMVPGVGPQTTRALLEHFRSAGRVLSRDPGRAARRGRHRPQAGREDRPGASGVRRGGGAGPLPSPGCAGHPARRPDVSLRAAEHPRPAGPDLREGTVRAARSAGDRAGRLAAMHALRGADRGAAGGRPVAHRFHDRLGAGARDRCRGPPRGDQGRGPQHRRAGQRPGLGLSARARGPGPRPDRGRRTRTARCRCGRSRWPACSPSATGSSPV